MPVIKEILSAMNCPCLELEGFEADDIIGTYSRIAEESGAECVILTGDKDSLQLVSDKTNVLLPVTKQGMTTTSRMDIEAVKEKLGGAAPCQVVDLKALMGDTSDNIPGVPGVGEKTAEGLLCEYGTLDGIYERIDEIKKPALKKKLEENKELAYLSKRLAEIVRDVPLGNAEAAAVERLETLRLKNYSAATLLRIFTRLEFKQLIKKMKLQERAEAELKSDDIIDCDTAGFSAEEGAGSALPFIDRPIVEIVLPDDMDKIDIDVNCECLYIDYAHENGEITEVTLFDGGGSFYRASFGFMSLEKLFAERLRSVFENESIKKCFFWAKDFVLWLKQNDITMGGLWCDLSIAAYLADSTRRNESAGEICRYFTGADKDGIGVMPYTAERALRLLDEYGMLRLYEQVEIPLVEILADFEYWGFCVSKEILIKEGELFGRRIDELTEQIYTLAGHEFNINSPKQLGEVLFEELRLPGGKNQRPAIRRVRRFWKSLRQSI